MKESAAAVPSTESVLPFCLYQALKGVLSQEESTPFCVFSLSGKLRKSFSEQVFLSSPLRNGNSP